MSGDFDYLLKRKPVKCPICRVEHKGRCHAMRNAKRKKTPPEKVLEYLLRWRERENERFARDLIEELFYAIDEARLAARFTDRRWRASQNKSRGYFRKNRIKAKRNTLTRK